MKRVMTLLMSCFHLTSLLGASKTEYPLTTGSTGLFKENKGQVCDQFHKPRPDVMYYGSTKNMDFHLRANGISYQLQQIESWKKRSTTPAQHPIKKGVSDSIPNQISYYRVDVDWVQANPHATVLAKSASSDYENFYSESSPNGALSVRSYKSVVYRNLYQGIDLEWTEQQGELKYNYHVQAGADYSQIQLHYKGSSKLFVNTTGELVIQTPFGNIVEQAPLVTQGSKQLRSSWIVNKSTASFHIEGLDPTQGFTIDPIIRLFGSYYGGQYADMMMVITDNVGNFYIFGESRSSSNMATSGSYQSSYAGGSTWGDAFLAKFDFLGSRQWATYYGGAQSDFANWCVADNGGNIYMVGGTSSTNAAVMATAGSHQSVSPGPGNTSQGTNDAFLAKFNSAGMRVWGSYYGGSNVEWAYHVSVDASSGDIAVTGCSYSSNGISTSGAHQAVISGTNSGDGFLARFTSSGTRLWGTYYGGNSAGQEDLTWSSFNSSGDIYIIGNTGSSNNIATPGSYQPNLGGSYDGFLARFNSSGTLLWGTYYGSPGNDSYSTGMLDSSDNLYIYGATSSSLASVFVSTGAHQTTFGGGLKDAYLAKFDPNGNRLWGTFYGGTGSEDIGIPWLNSNGDLYICGLTSSASAAGTAIATACAYQNNYGGGSSDGFFAKFNTSGSRQWGTLYGGSANDILYSAAVDFHGSLYVCGVTNNSLSAPAFTSSGAYQTTYGGGSYDSFFAKFDGCAPLSPANTTPQHQLHVCIGKTATLTTNCGNWYADSLSTLALGSGSLFTTGPLQHDTTFYIEETSCGYSIGRTAVHLTVMPPPTINILQTNTTACIGEYTDLTANGASTYTWQGLNPGAPDTINPVTVWLIIPTSYTVTGTDQYGCKNNSTISVVPNLCLGVNESNTDLDLEVFPNPNAGSFTIRSSRERQFNLMNALGEIVWTFAVQKNQTYDLHFPELRSGLYFLKDEKTSISKKIVVMH